MAANCGLFGPQLELEQESNRTQQKRKQRMELKNNSTCESDNGSWHESKKTNQKKKVKNILFQHSSDISATWHVTLEPSRSDPHNFAYNHNSAHISNVVGRIQESRQQGGQLGDGKRC